MPVAEQPLGGLLPRHVGKRLRAAVGHRIKPGALFKQQIETCPDSRRVETGAWPGHLPKHRLHRRRGGRRHIRCAPGPLIVRRLQPPAQVICRRTPRRRLRLVARIGVYLEQLQSRAPSEQPTRRLAQHLVRVRRAPHVDAHELELRERLAFNVGDRIGVTKIA